MNSYREERPEPFLKSKKKGGVWRRVLETNPRRRKVGSPVHEVNTYTQEEYLKMTDREDLQRRGVLSIGLWAFISK